MVRADFNVTSMHLQLAGNDTVPSSCEVAEVRTLQSELSLAIQKSGNRSIPKYNRLTFV